MISNLEAQKIINERKCNSDCINFTKTYIAMTKNPNHPANKLDWHGFPMCRQCCTLVKFAVALGVYDDES